MNPPASWAEVDELLGHADARIVQEIVETEASIDEIAAAIETLDDKSRPRPEPPRIARVRRILEGMRRGLTDEGTIPIGGVPIGGVVL